MHDRQPAAGEHDHPAERRFERRPPGRQRLRRPRGPLGGFPRAVAWGTLRGTRRDAGDVARVPGREVALRRTIPISGASAGLGRGMALARPA